ncbi:MAG: GNAT family N-acetyltransferase [Actinobacteria bacterium]|nr:GNAT family N-acetyltransferase [Actinomycetota bacterium]
MRRPAAPGDDALLRALFVQSREDLLLLPTSVRDGLLDMQFRAQRRQLAEDFPRAEFEVLSLDGVDVGLLVTAERDGALHVVDLIVEPARRGQGVGTAALRSVLAEAEAGARPVRLQVWSGNGRARELYERLGFVAQPSGPDEGHITMEHGAGTWVSHS